MVPKIFETPAPFAVRRIVQRLRSWTIHNAVDMKGISVYNIENRWRF